jgi:hypothetical protein
MVWRGSPPTPTLAMFLPTTPWMMWNALDQRAGCGTAVIKLVILSVEGVKQLGLSAGHQMRTEVLLLLVPTTGAGSMVPWINLPAADLSAKMETPAAIRRSDMEQRRVAFLDPLLLI